MPAIISDQFRMQNAFVLKQFFETRNIYMFIGRTQPWQIDFAPFADDNPPLPIDSVEYTDQIWKEMTMAKKIPTADVSLCVDRIDWMSGTVYDMYSSDDPDLFRLKKKFYVLTNDFSVYKCIDNAGGKPSSVKPTGKSTQPIKTSDGYTWKFMYSLTTTELEKFLTPQHLPVKFIPAPTEDQATIIASAVPGSIIFYKVINGGSGYLTTPTLTVQGTGAGAQITPILQNGSIVGVNVVNQGQGYSSALVQVTGGGGSGAVIKPMISPPGGHGSQAPFELGAFYAMITAKLGGEQYDKLPINNDFRMIGLLADPLAKQTGLLFTGAIAAQTIKLKVNTLTGFAVDDKIQSNMTNQITNIVSLQTVGSENFIYVQGDVLPVSVGDTFKKVGSPSTQAQVQQVFDQDMFDNSGTVIYVEQRKPIPRDENQIELIRIIIEY